MCAGIKKELISAQGNKRLNTEEYSDKEGQNLRILPSSLSRNLASLVTSKEKEFYVSQNASRNKKQIESLISESKYTQLYSYKNVFFVEFLQVNVCIEK